MWYWCAGEPARGVRFRARQEQRVGSIGQLLDAQLALAAVRQMGDGGGPLIAGESAQREFGSGVAELAALHGAHWTATSGATTVRSLRSPLRMRVLAVPSGIPSSSAISRAVRPWNADKTMARRCSIGSACRAALTL